MRKRITGTFSPFSHTGAWPFFPGARPCIRFGRNTIQSIMGPDLSALNHILYWRRMARPPSVAPSSTSSVTTVSGGGGGWPYISREKNPETVKLGEYFKLYGTCDGIGQQIMWDGLMAMLDEGSDKGIVLCTIAELRDFWALLDANGRAALTDELQAMA